MKILDVLIPFSFVLAAIFYGPVTFDALLGIDDIKGVCLFLR
jgi:hypothetical protein